MSERDRVLGNKHSLEPSCPDPPSRQSGSDLTDLSLHLSPMGTVSATTNLVDPAPLGSSRISDITGDHGVLIETLRGELRPSSSRGSDVANPGESGESLLGED